MAVIITTSTTRSIGVDEFLDFVRQDVDLRDIDSIAAAAPMLRALANNREFLIERLNQLVIDRYRSQSIPSAQVISLGAGPNFYVRANIWPSADDIAGGRIHQDQYAYDLAHDHNYNFLTVAYHGPGYRTDLYEYDFESITGTPGETVDLHSQGTLQFEQGMVMLYRASRDVHTQSPPDDLSITLNLMASPDTVRLRDHYHFDLRTSTLMDYPVDNDSSMRRTLLHVAAKVGGDRTQELLAYLANCHPCRRTRLAAFDALAVTAAGNATDVWEQACRSTDPFVVKEGRARLQASG